jgi:cytochrome c peroxidase
LLVYQLPGLPFQDYGGPGDHIDPKLLKDTNRFHRIPLGGRPMTVRYTSDGSRILIANYLDNSVQIVDPASRGIVRTLSLGGPKRPSLARQGEALFVDGKRSLEQWYSCHSCHYEGHTNSLVMDTRNDGRDGNFKTVLSLRNVTHTPPYTWHGWQKELDLSIRKSMTDSMLGKEPTEAEVKALSAYLETLKPPPNPYRQEDGSLTPEAQRGEKIFRSVKAGCSTCHSGPYFTDGKIHDVGLGKRDDAFKGFNTPSLIGLYDRVLLLHDGRATSLEEVLKGPHNPTNWPT